MRRIRTDNLLKSVASALIRGFRLSIKFRTLFFTPLNSVSINPKLLKEDINLTKAGIGFLFICFLLLLGASPAAAQDSQLQPLKPSVSWRVQIPGALAAEQDLQLQPLRLDAAVNLALRHYPSVRASQAQAAAAEAGIDVARVPYLPRVDMLWRQNIATRNNVFGLLFPQSVAPPISGPAFEKSTLRGAAGSAGGLSFSWEP
jgi:hypothetical protein